MQRSSRASWPTTSLASRFASQVAACLTVLTVASCSQIVDFDRSKIADETKDGAGPRDSGMGGDEGGTKDAGPKDSGMTMTEAGIDGGEDECDPATHEGCEPNELCCADPAGVLACVPTSATQCEACGMACDSNVANVCTERTCGCGATSKIECSGAAPNCDPAQDKCVECVTSSDCSANATNKFCFLRLPGAAATPQDNTCVACDPATNAGCSGTTPVCDAAGACQACSMTPNNCGGTLVCLANGACQCASSSDCTTPTTPICDSASKVCIACATDAQCNSKTAGRVCVTGGAGSTVGTCAVCDPQDDGGCSGTNNQCKPGATPVCVDCLADSDCGGATPLCNLTTNACVACDAAAIPAGDRDTRCAARSGANDICATSGTKKGECAACDPTDDGGCSDPNTPACTNASVCVQCTSTKLARCNDSSLCTTDACNGSNVCTNTAVSTSDGISCTADSCVAATGVVHTPNNGACEIDTFSCTAPTCSTTSGCSETANDALCVDAVSCTDDDCVGAGGNANGCTNTPTNGMCPNTDGKDCSVPTCSATMGCSEALTASRCNDNVACTTNECVGAAGDASGCTFTPDSAACPNADAIACTIPTCSAVSGCSEVPDNAACPSGDAFTCTIPTCSALTGCSELPNDGQCDDGVSTTVDTCNPALGAPVSGCLNTP